MTPKPVLTCWHSWSTALATQYEKEVYPDIAMQRWQSAWSLFVMLRVQKVCPPNQCWCDANLHWQQFPPSKKQKCILILWCCVGNLENGKCWFRRLSTQHRKKRIYYFLWPGDNYCHLRMSTRQHGFWGHTPWTLRRENVVFLYCQRSIAKTGYTTFSEQVTIAVI